MTVKPTTPKELARAVLEKLPEHVTWDDIVYELAARRSIEFGLSDAGDGRVTEASALRRELRVELDRRLAAYERDPTAGVPWTELKQRLLDSQ